MKLNPTQDRFYTTFVALFTRAWIEIRTQQKTPMQNIVALFTRAWIEMKTCYTDFAAEGGRPLYEGVD